MKREQIIKWRDKYDNEEDLYNTGLEEDLRKKFQANKFITKEDLKKIIEWKFQGPLIPRGKIFLKCIKEVDEEFIKDLSKLTFKIHNDETRIKLLCVIDGVGPAVASVILAFYDPDKYGVLDIHAWRELFGKEPNDLFGSPKCCMKFFDELRSLSKKHRLPCRDIEKALFKKNYDKS